MTDEEILAKEMADIVKGHIKEQLAPLQQRIKELETESIVAKTELRLLKELHLTNRDEKHMPGLTFPGENSLRRAGHSQP